MQYALVFLSFLLVSSLAVLHAADYYISRQAMDQATGTQEAPLASVVRGLERLLSPCGQPAAGCLRFAPAQGSIVGNGQTQGVALGWDGSRRLALSEEGRRVWPVCPVWPVWPVCSGDRGQVRSTASPGPTARPIPACRPPAARGCLP